MPTETPETPTVRQYLVRSTDASGTRVLAWVPGATASDARASRLAEGHRDLEFLTDDGLRTLEPAGEPAPPTDPAGFVAGFYERGPIGAWLLGCWLVYKVLWKIVAPAAIVFIVRRVAQLPPNWIDLVAIGGLVLPLLVRVFAGTNSIPLSRRMLKAWLGCRWDEVITLSNRLESESAKLGNNFGTRMSATEWRAKAMARQGRVEEAFATVEAFAADPRVSTETACYLRAAVFHASNRPAEAAACFEAMTVASPQNPYGWIGAAETYAMLPSRPTEARAAFERLRVLPLMPMHQWAAAAAEGSVLLAECRWHDARAVLERSLRERPATMRGSVLEPLTTSVLRVQLAIACARCGDPRAAEMHFRKGRKLVELHEIEPLLSRARAELGLTPDRPR